MFLTHFKQNQNADFRREIHLYTLNADYMRKLHF